MSADIHAQNTDEELKLSPSACVALRAVFADTVEELSTLHKVASCSGSMLQTTLTEEEEEDDVAKNSDTLIKELNRIFFETLIRFEKCRREDYIAEPDGTFRKLREDESKLRTFLEEIEREIDVFQVLEREIDASGNFTSLKVYCDDKQAIVNMPVELARTIMNNEQYIKFLEAKIRATIVDLEERNVFFNELIRKLKHEWQEARQMALMSSKYLKASYEQRVDHYNTIRDEETRLLIGKAQTFKKRLGADKRQVYEISSSLFTEIASHTNRLRYLQSLTTVQDLTSELEALTSRLEQLRKDHEQLKLDYAKCEEVVLDNRVAYEQREIEERINHKLLVAIFQVQAWWRAIMVLRGIKAKPKKRGRRK